MSVCSSQRATGLQCARNAALVHPASWEWGIIPWAPQKMEFPSSGEGQDFSGCFNHEPGQVKTFNLLFSWTKIFWKYYFSVLSEHSAVVLYCLQIHSNNNSSVLMYRKTWDLLHLKSQSAAWLTWSSAAWPWAWMLKNQLKKEKVPGVITAEAWLPRNTEQNTNRISFHEILTTAV